MSKLPRFAGKPGGFPNVQQIPASIGAIDGVLPQNLLLGGREKNRQCRRFPRAERLAIKTFDKCRERENISRVPDRHTSGSLDSIELAFNRSCQPTVGCENR